MHLSQILKVAELLTPILSTTFGIESIALLLLLFLRQYPTIRFLAWIFQSSTHTIESIIWQAINIIFRIASKHFDRFPSYEERQQTAIKFYGHNIILIVDGTEQKIVEHVNNAYANQTRSGKKGYHSCSKIVGVTPTGQARLIGRSYIPHHDFALITMSDCMVKLKTLHSTESIGGDPAFEGLADILPCGVLTSPKKIPGGQLGPKEKELKTRWKTYRTVVENYFSQVKDFKILRETFRCKGDISEILEKHHRIFVVCAFFIDIFLFPEGTKMYNRE
jgi:hypothetical protein